MATRLFFQVEINEIIRSYKKSIATAKFTRFEICVTLKPDVGVKQINDVIF